MRDATAQRPSTMIPIGAMQQRPSRMSDMRREGTWEPGIIRAPDQEPVIRRASAAPCSLRSRGTLAPAPRFSVLPDRQIGVELDRVGFAEQLHQAVVFFHQIVRQRGDAEPLLAGAHEPEDVVDLEIGFARTRAVAAGIDQPAGSANAVAPASPSMMMRCESRSSSVRGVPKRLMYSGEQ
jgi:hypothetical protein